MDENWEVDDIIQIGPLHDKKFGSALLVVTEVKVWGVQGYVFIPGQGQAFYRLPFPDEEETFLTGIRVGKAYWLMEFST